MAVGREFSHGALWATQTISTESKLYSEETMRAPFLLGRLIFGGYFIFSGINHFKQTREMAQYVATKKVPNPTLAVQLTGAVLVAGGASILLGIKPKLGSAAIVGFLAGVSPIMHDFWKHEDPQQRMNEMVNFTKNLALAGAATALMGIEEPWPASVTPKPSARQRAKKILRESIAA
jgi:uncharacterized membrane protein YphA (DoxX/SURF4 family)